jgi:hypothetical protein
VLAAGKLFVLAAGRLLIDRDAAMGSEIVFGRQDLNLRPPGPQPERSG